MIVRVYTQIGVKESGKFALQMATRTLDYFADYFAIVSARERERVFCAPI